MIGSKDSWDPDQYHRFQRERAQPFQDLMALLEPASLVGARAVDLGCGSGELTAELHRQMGLAETLGIDNSTAMLSKAATHVGKGIHFETATIEGFSADAEYDLVFSNAAIQWCSNHWQIFRSLRRALKPGAQLAVQMPMNFDYPTHTLARQMMLEAPYRESFERVHAPGESMLTPEEYASLLFRLGFQEQQVFTRVYGHILAERGEVIEWVKGTLLTSIQSRLPPPLHSLFLEEYRNRLFEKLADDRPFFYPFKRILIWGRLG